ncbi:MAG: Hpt domain-containing protein, partial [Gammaproteobacteria bacterium SHHR-1]
EEVLMEALIRHCRPNGHGADSATPEPETSVGGSGTRDSGLGTRNLPRMFHGNDQGAENQAAVEGGATQDVGLGAGLPASVAEAEALQATPDQGLIDWAQVKAKYAKREGLQAKLVRIALDQVEPLPETLRQLAEGEDYASCAFQAHLLKNVGGNIPAPRLVELALATEQAARAEQPQCFDQLRQLADLTQAFAEELQQWLA